MLNIFLSSPPAPCVAMVIIVAFVATLADTFTNIPAMPMPTGGTHKSAGFLCPDDMLMTDHQQNNLAIIFDTVA